MSQKIVVVDDDPSTVKLLEGVLSSAGYEVSSVEDGVNALVEIREQSPDLVVLDLMMPKLDGFNVCRMLKFDENYKGIKIIILTSRTHREDRTLCEEVGADAFAEKPINSSEFIALVGELLKD